MPNDVCIPSHVTILNLVNRPFKMYGKTPCSIEIARGNLSETVIGTCMQV